MQFRLAKSLFLCYHNDSFYKIFPKYKDSCFLFLSEAIFLHLLFWWAAVGLMKEKVALISLISALVASSERALVKGGCGREVWEAHTNVVPSFYVE